MRFILGSLLFLSAFYVNDPTIPQPVATHVESLAYPDFARAAQLQGTVDVEIIIRGDGAVSSAYKKYMAPFRAASIERVKRELMAGKK